MGLGTKELEEDAELWDDYEMDKYGDHYLHKDDPDYAEGFKWSCCGKSGGDPGCFRARHQGFEEFDKDVLAKHRKTNAAAATTAVPLKVPKRAVPAASSKASPEDDEDENDLERILECAVCGNEYNDLDNEECYIHEGM